MIDWTEQYNIYTSRAGLATIVCAWTSDGYRISVNSVTLKARVHDLKIAKESGIKLARTLILKSLSELKELEDLNGKEN